MKTQRFAMICGVPAFAARTGASRVSSEDLGFSLGEATRVTYFTIKQVKCVLLTTGLQIYEFSSEEHNFEKLI